MQQVVCGGSRDERMDIAVKGFDCFGYPGVIHYFFTLNYRVPPTCSLGGTDSFGIETRAHFATVCRLRLVLRHGPVVVLLIRETRERPPLAALFLVLLPWHPLGLAWARGLGTPKNSFFCASKGTRGVRQHNS